MSGSTKGTGISWVRRMTEVIILETIRDINKRINEDIEFYQGKLDQANTRLAILKVERQQLVDLINILEAERNK